MNAAGSLSAAYEYDPFGQPLKSLGDYADRNPFRVNTKYVDQESGLRYYGYRYSNPQIGKWLSRDPLQEEGGANLYLYNHNDPILFVDPLGLQVRSDRNFGPQDRDPRTGERYGIYRDQDRRQAERTRELRRRMIRVLPNPAGRPGLEFLPDSSMDHIISKWRPHLERWYKQMLADCKCKQAFKDAGLDLEAVDRLGVIVSSGNALRDQSLSDEQVKVPQSIRYRDDIRQSIQNDRGFSFFVPGSPDTRAHIFFNQEAFSANLFETSACSLRRTFVHELIHAAGAGAQKPTNWIQQNIFGHDDLSTWMPGEYAKIIAACGCK